MSAVKEELIRLIQDQPDDRSRDEILRELADVVEAIYARAQILEDFPRSGQAYRTESGRKTRIIMWGHYRIVDLAACGGGATAPAPRWSPLETPRAPLVVCDPKVPPKRTLPGA